MVAMTASDRLVSDHGCCLHVETWRLFYWHFLSYSLNFGFLIHPARSVFHSRWLFLFFFLTMSYRFFCNLLRKHLQDMIYLQNPPRQLLILPLSGENSGFLSCLVVSIIAIPLCMVLLTLTSQGFKRVQNQLTRLVTKPPPFTQSLPLLRSLHWLPARFRILFKINLLTYKTLREKQPVYLHSMLATSIPSRSLRSNNNNSLIVSRVKTNTGARAFHSCAPSRWNNLPLSVHSAISVVTFKKHLKTHLLDLAFPP